MWPHSLSKPRDMVQHCFCSDTLINLIDPCFLSRWPRGKRLSVHIQREFEEAVRLELTALHPVDLTGIPRCVRKERKHVLPRYLLVEKRWLTFELASALGLNFAPIHISFYLPKHLFEPEIFTKIKWKY